MLPEYSHTKSKSLAQISTPMAETHNFFSRGLFSLAHPVYMDILQCGNCTSKPHQIFCRGSVLFWWRCNAICCVLSVLRLTSCFLVICAMARPMQNGCKLKVNSERIISTISTAKHLRATR